MNAAALREDVPSLFVADQRGVGAPAGPCRILLVEDDAVDRMALRRHIAQHRLNYELTEVASVGEARRRLTAGQFDLLLLDCNLPDGTGFDLIEPANGEPAVFLAGSDNLELAVRAIRAGAADYLVKDTARAYLTMLPFTATRVIRQRRTQAALQASQTQLRRLLDCLPTAAFACDAQGLSPYFNDETPRLRGRVPRLHDPEERCCRSLRFTWPDGTPVDHEQCWRALTEKREVLAYANPMFDAQGVLSGVINLGVDVTAMRKLERRQRALEAHVAHSRKLEAVVQLAENSLEAMGAAGGVLEIGLGRLGPDDALRQRHTPIRPEHTLRLWVRDTGPGREAAVVERLFEPFFTTRSPGQGTGRGLAGIYGTIMRHRGAVVAESAPGAGTTMSLLFPVAEAGFVSPDLALSPANPAVIFQPDSNPS